MAQIQEEPLFLKYVGRTDESKFTNNGIINKQNNRFWSDHNPYWTNDSNFQHVWGTNVWCGLLCGKLLGPYFYDGTLTGRRYLNFLSNILPTFLDEVNLDTRMNLFFQQDGAPAYNAIIIRKYLTKLLIINGGGRMIEEVANDGRCSDVAKTVHKPQSNVTTKKYV